MAELVPGVFAEIMTRLAAEGEAKVVPALTAVALVVERQAKINASTGEHPYRTKTPSPGDPVGPARISGTLVRSITHTPVERTAVGWAVKVGMAGGAYPWYSHRTPASKYAYYLEVSGAGKSHHRFPFLVPALRFAGRTAVYTIFKEVMGTGWGAR